MRIVLVACLLVPGNAQIPAEPNAVALELRLEPKALIDGVPQTFTFTLVNRSGHEMRLPMPAVECSFRETGRFHLGINFTPLNPHGYGPGRGGGCGGGSFDRPSILERVKAWRLLRPGESLSITANRERFYYDDREPGKYEFWATYTPPELNLRDQETLEAAGISFPALG